MTFNADTSTVVKVDCHKAQPFSTREHVVELGRYLLNSA